MKHTLPPFLALPFSLVLSLVLVLDWSLAVPFFYSPSPSPSPILVLDLMLVTGRTFGHSLVADLGGIAHT